MLQYVFSFVLRLDAITELIAPFVEEDGQFAEIRLGRPMLTQSQKK
jgi:hypothetical protein